MRSLLAGVLLASVLLQHGRADSDGDTVPLGRGVNLGNFLEAPREGDWSGGRLLQAGDFSNIKQAGFTFVRVPIRWAAHLSGGPDAAIDPAFLDRIDWVVAQAEKNGLQAILDYHNDDELIKNPGANADRFVATWKQIAAHYKDVPPSILFELLNEPYDHLDAAHWNGLLARALAEVRATNPTRTVVIGPTKWNNIDTLPELVLPDADRHLLVTVHFYDPFHFTHQGASWAPGSDKWLGTSWQGSDADKKPLADKLDLAAKWGETHRRPIYLGEFGAYEKGDMDSRARWTAFIARTAESHGFAWSYWEYCSGFGVYDPIAEQWRQPLLQALLPKP